MTDTTTADSRPAEPPLNESSKTSKQNGHQGAPAPEGEAAPTESSANAKPPRQNAPPPFSVRDIKVGSTDGRGLVVEEIYFCRACYAIYKSGGRLMIQYDDDDERASNQISQVADLVPMRDRLQFLINAAEQPNMTGRYHPQVAEAFRLGLEGRPEAAQKTIEGAIQDVLEARGRTGRAVYLKYAVKLALSIAFALFALSVLAAGLLNPNGTIEAVGTLVHLMLATASGAVGALLSISIGLRNRTVATDAASGENAVDATIRVMIGVISAAVLYLLIGSGLLSMISFSDVKLKPEAITWKLALVIGFAAGFIERLVPDILTKASDTDGAAKNSAGA